MARGQGERRNGILGQGAGPGADWFRGCSADLGRGSDRPASSTVGSHAVLIHIANLLLLSCYLVRDILLLRVAATVASGCFIAYFMMLEVPNRAAATWNVVYVVVNAVQIALLVRERMRGQLTGAEAALHERIFPWMPAHKFATLVRLAAPAYLGPSDPALVERGHPVASLWLIEGGELEVVVDGQRVATCIPGDFVGEMAFIDRAA
ncbi:MAG: hypothetical protein FJ252_09435, partial [Phycisphaerae bacterium]|nr:hypothetical protein [Phycisphaerae bacterium]